MHHEQQASFGVVANDCVTGFVVSAGIYQPEQRVEEHFCGLLERDAVMLCDIDARLLVVSDEGSATEFKADVHARMLLLRMYIVNT